MKVNIYRIPFAYWHSDKEFKLTEQGYLEVEKFDAEECWHLCNWSCWADEKPENLYSNIEFCNSDVVFHDTERNEFHIALPFGWKEVYSLEQVKEFFMKKEV